MPPIKTFSTDDTTINKIDEIVKLTRKSQAQILKEAIKDYHEKILKENDKEVINILDNAKQFKG